MFYFISGKHVSFLCCSGETMETFEVEAPAIPTEEQPAPNHGPPYPKKKKKVHGSKEM